MPPQERLIDSIKRDLHWASVTLRLLLGTLFLSTAIIKVPNGISGTIGYYESIFQDSLLPSFLVSAHASVIMIVEFVMAAWLISGYRLATAWKASALLMASLAIGMVFAGKFDHASDDYLYLFFCGIGLLTSRFDRWTVGHVEAQESAHSSETHPLRQAA